ncbi:hypothetical protein ABIC83_002899 [Roseateles asaccharophilus]|uniref:hypothetical protein n=1 Tax=Roseateles asaccharophilus TaxID=582607 RepID=UPI00383288FA
MKTSSTPFTTSIRVMQIRLVALYAAIPLALAMATGEWACFGKAGLAVVLIGVADIWWTARCLRPTFDHFDRAAVRAAKAKAGEQ